MATRMIDAETLTSYSWMGERYRLMRKKQVSLVIALLIITFFAGAMSSIIWDRGLAIIFEQVGL